MSTNQTRRCPNVKSIKQTLPLITALCLVPMAAVLGGDTPKNAENEVRATWKPVASTASGLLLEPPLDLSKFTQEDFVAISGTVGLEKIRKPWTSAVKALPPHTRKEIDGLTEKEVKDYMLQVRRLFDEGAAFPVSDVGLISTQEDVIRRPMLNHVSAFANETAHVYLLVQKSLGDRDWGYFSIVRDRTTKPPVDYYAEIKGAAVKFEGTSCYKCHSSGPLAIHPVRADLVSDALLATAISEHIADQPLSRFHFPENDRPPDYGKPLALKACVECHDRDGVRAPLFRIQSHPIRILVDFGYMPPQRRLTPSEIEELKDWLEQKP